MNHNESQTLMSPQLVGVKMGARLQ